MARTVVALYDDFASANATVRDLVDNGFPQNEISIIASDATGEYGRYINNPEITNANAPDNMAEATPPSATSSGAGVGAGIGAVIGGLGGLLVGLGALAIPGIGPVIAAGPLAAAITGLAGAGAGAVAGGVTGGILGALVDMGIPNETAQYYAEGIRRGGTLVTIRTPDNLAERARDIMNQHNPIDVNERANQWRQAGWTGFDTGTPIAPRETVHNETIGQDQEWPATGAPANQQPLGENLGANPNAGPMGSNVTNANTGPVENQGVNMNSEPVGNMGTAANPAPVETQGTFQNTNATPNVTDFSTYNSDFRNHFATTMSGSGYTYEQYQPAYRYGYDLATNSRYRNRNWNEVEPEARRYWEERNPGTWDRIKNAVQYAWQETKNAV